MSKRKSEREGESGKRKCGVGKADRYEWKVQSMVTVHITVILNQACRTSYQQNSTRTE